MKKKKIIIAIIFLVIIAVAAVVLLRLKGTGDDADKENPVISAPVVYQLDKKTSVVALPVGDGIEVREEKPKKEKQAADSGESAQGEDGQSASADQEEEGPAVTVSVTYHYEGFAGHIERIKNYCDLLMAEDFGFVPVDENVIKTKLPTFEKLAGNVCLVRPIGSGNASNEGTDEGGESESLFMIQLQWNSDHFSAAVGQIEGGIVTPPEPKPMTLMEAVDYFHTLDPSVLGLSGETMDDYQVLALDGAVLVGTTPCLRMNVYKKDEKTGTNVIAGQYLFSNTGRELYWVGLGGEIQKITQ